MYLKVDTGKSNLDSVNSVWRSKISDNSLKQEWPIYSGSLEKNTELWLVRENATVCSERKGESKQP